MSREETFNKLKELISENFEIDAAKITENLNFKDDLDADSIDFVEFILALEDEFGAEIPDEDAAELLTVGQAVDYIMQKQNA